MAMLFEYVVYRCLQEIFKRGYYVKYKNELYWYMLHNYELDSSYRSPNIVRTIKSRSLSWVGHVARMGDRRTVFKTLTGKPTGK